MAPAAQTTDYPACSSIAGASWQTYDMNFEDIFQSLLSLFVLSTIEGWPDYLFNFIDANDGGPTYNNSQYMFLFFMVFIFVSSLFMMNLFVGVIFLNYHIAEKAAKNIFLTDEQERWIELQRLILVSAPDYGSIKQPKNRIRKIVRAHSPSRPRPFVACATPSRRAPLITRGPPRTRAPAVRCGKSARGTCSGSL